MVAVACIGVGAGEILSNHSSSALARRWIPLEAGSSAWVLALTVVGLTALMNPQSWLCQVNLIARKPNLGT